jgi:hypothetical protein
MHIDAALCEAVKMIRFTIGPEDVERLVASLEPLSDEGEQDTPGFCVFLEESADVAHGPEVRTADPDRGRLTHTVLRTCQIKQS